MHNNLSIKEIYVSGVDLSTTVRNCESIYRQQSELRVDLSTTVRITSRSNAAFPAQS